MPTAEVCRKHNISPASFYKYKAKFGGMDVSDARRLKALEDENAMASESVEQAKDIETLRMWLVEALSSLNERERFIVQERKLKDQPRTLESLGIPLETA